VAIPQNFIQDLLSRADIVEIVGRYVQLKKGGANFLGLCPFHGEKTPSFTVSPAKQFYHCFGCGKHGNAIGFLMDYASMNFVEAVKDLAGQYGMQVPEDDVSPQDRARAAEQRQKQATITDVLEKAGAAYRKHLRGSTKAIAYLKGRGLSGEVAKQFGLGYAPEGWRTLASVFPSYDDPLLAESGLVIVNEEDDKRYDRFRDRVMFPIRNVKGECIGFGGRVLGEGTPKYLNSPETPVFSKGRATRSTNTATCSSPKATWTWWRWPSSASPTRWPRWGRPAPPSTCRSCSGSPTRWSSASTATPPAAAPPAVPWKAPCPTPPTCAR
jgi:DNA primase